MFVRWTWSDEGTLVQQQQPPPSGTRCCGCDEDDHARWEQCKRWAADGREVALRAGQQRTWRGGEWLRRRWSAEASSETLVGEACPHGLGGRWETPGGV